MGIAANNVTPYIRITMLSTIVVSRVLRYLGVMDDLSGDELRLKPINDLRKYAKRLSVNAGGSKDVIIGRISEARASLLIADEENREENGAIVDKTNFIGDEGENDVWTNVLSPKRSVPSAHIDGSRDIESQMKASDEQDNVGEMEFKAKDGKGEAKVEEKEDEEEEDEKEEVLDTKPSSPASVASSVTREHLSPQSDVSDTNDLLLPMWGTPQPVRFDEPETSEVEDRQSLVLGHGALPLIEPLPFEPVRVSVGPPLTPVGYVSSGNEEMDGGDTGGSQSGRDRAIYDGDIEAKLHGASSFSAFRESVLLDAAISRQSLERRHAWMKTQFVCTGGELLQLMEDLSVNENLSSSLVVPTSPEAIVHATSLSPETDNAPALAPQGSAVGRTACHSRSSASPVDNSSAVAPPIGRTLARTPPGQSPMIRRRTPPSSRSSSRKGSPGTLGSGGKKTSPGDSTRSYTRRSPDLKAAAASSSIDDVLSKPRAMSRPTQRHTKPATTAPPGKIGAAVKSASANTRARPGANTTGSRPAQIRSDTAVKKPGVVSTASTSSCSHTCAGGGGPSVAAMDRRVKIDAQRKARKEDAKRRIEARQGATEGGASAPIQAGRAVSKAREVAAASSARSVAPGEVGKEGAAGIVKRGISSATTATKAAIVYSTDSLSVRNSNNVTASGSSGTSNVAVNPFAFTGAVPEPAVPTRPTVSVPVNAFSSRATSTAAPVPVQAVAKEGRLQVSPNHTSAPAAGKLSQVKKGEVPVVPPLTSKSVSTSKTARAPPAKAPVRGVLTARNTGLAPPSQAVPKPNSESKAPPSLSKKASPPSKKASPPCKGASKPKKVSPPRKAANPFAAMI